MKNSPNQLNICFLLKTGNTFKSEQQIIDSSDELKRQVQNNELDLVNPDGALSIIWNDKELLGQEYWDEIVSSMLAVPINLDELINGKTIQVRFALEPIRLTLTRNQNNLQYRLVSLNSTLSINETIPFSLFLQEWLLCFCRVIRICNMLGLNDDSIIQAMGKRIESGQLNILDVALLKDTLEKPLDEVIQAHNCGN